LLTAEAMSDSGRGAPDLASLGGTVSRAERLEVTAARRALEPAEVAELESIIDSVDALLDAWRYASAGER
jgi:hypothetical protein